MSSELKRECIKTGKKLKEASFEQRIDLDITLPDYCADIKKILRCSLVPGVHTVSLSGEKASAKGTGTVRIIYLAEGDKTDVFEKNIDLSSSVQFKEISPEAVITAQSAVDFVNCRAISQRKITVSASVSTHFSLFATADESYALEDEKGQVQVKKEKLVCENHLGFFEKTFDLAETVVLNGEHPAVGKIISCSTHIANESHKLSSGKLLVKGDAVTEICYLPEKSEGGLHRFIHTMPISQIADLKDVPDGALCSVRLRVCQSLCSCKADSSGSNRLVDIALRISAFIHAHEKKECEVIVDCYCNNYETQATFDEMEINCPVRNISEAGQAKGEVEFSSPVREICFSGCTEITANVRYYSDKVQLECSALVLIMYLDDKGIPCCTEKNLDFELDYSIVRKCTDPFGFFSLEPLMLSAVLTSSDKAELTLDYTVEGKVYCRHDGKILRSLRVLEDKPKKNSNAALTVYFAEKGEELWSIAREHGTTVELIVEENGLKTEIIGERIMLLLPCR